MKERGDKQGGNGEREMAEREKRIKGTMEREKGNKTRRDRGREGDRKDKGKQEGTGGGGRV